MAPATTVTLGYTLRLSCRPPTNARAVPLLGGDSAAPRAILEMMSYLGNLTCRDCGLTFTSRWGSVRQADEYRCGNDHVAFVEARAGTILSVDGAAGEWGTLVERRGLCPCCGQELGSGLLPACPVCGGRDHDVILGGDLL